MSTLLILAFFGVGLTAFISNSNALPRQHGVATDKDKDLDYSFNKTLTNRNDNNVPKQLDYDNVADKLADGRAISQNISGNGNGDIKVLKNHQMAKENIPQRKKRLFLHYKQYIENYLALTTAKPAQKWSPVLKRPHCPCANKNEVVKPPTPTVPARSVDLTPTPVTRPVPKYRVVPMTSGGRITGQRMHDGRRPPNLPRRHSRLADCANSSIKPNGE